MTKNTSAPVLEQTPLLIAQTQLSAVQAKLNKAKSDHETNMKRVNELRELLKTTLPHIAASDYETLSEQEAILQARVDTLQADLTRRQKTGLV